MAPVEQGVKVPVQISKLRPVFRLDRRIELALDRFKLFDVAILLVTDEPARQEGLDHAPDLVDIAHEIGIDGADAGAPVGDELDDPFALQLLKGLATGMALVE